MAGTRHIIIYLCIIYVINEYFMWNMQVQYFKRELQLASHTLQIVMKVIACFL